MGNDLIILNRKEKIHFWFVWTYTHLVILIFGFILGGIGLLLIHGAFGFSQNEWGTPLSQTLGHIVAGTVLGFSVGYYQRIYVQKLINVPVFWIYAPVIGFTAAELISGIILTLIGINRGEIKFIEADTPGTMSPETLIYAFAGLLTGLIQWPMLRRKTGKSFLWPIASAAGWGLCIMVTVVSVWAFFAGVLIYGGITGAALLLMNDDRKV